MTFVRKIYNRLYAIILNVYFDIIIKRTSINTKLELIIDAYVENDQKTILGINAIFSSQTPINRPLYKGCRLETSLFYNRTCF